VSPNEVTYSTLVNISPDYDTALKWYEKMVEKGVSPDEVTYSTLVNISPDYDTALKWYEKMVEKGVSPNEVTHTTLVKKCPDFTAALQLTEQINRAKGFIGRGYFCALFAKDILHLSGEELLGIYHSLPFRFEVSLEPAIRAYLSAERLDDALRLCLFAPHLPAAIRLYRQKGPESVAWFSNILAEEPESANGVYGRAICLFVNGKFPEAEVYLRQARDLAYAGKRIDYIDCMLREIVEPKEESADPTKKVSKADSAGQLGLCPDR